MFLTSSDKPIEPQLRDWVDQIEKQSPGLSVLAARQFCYSLYQTPVEVTISESRKFNVLEEFILRAGIELVPPPTVDELASVLGLDPIFVRGTTATLQRLQTLEPLPGTQITLTPQGRQFYAQGSVPQPQQNKQIYAIADPLLGNLALRSSPIDAAQVNFPNLEDFVTLDDRIPDNFSLTLEELQQLFQQAKLGDGKTVTFGRVISEAEEIWQTIALFVLFDALEDKVKLQVRRGKQILEEASNWLDMLQAESKVSLNDLCQLSEEVIASERETISEKKNQEVEARLEKIRQKALDNVREIRADQNTTPVQAKAETGSVVVLRDSQIREKFLQALKSARSNILIYSPWVSEAVVDNEFILLLQKLANFGVWILIGHGISRRQEDEDRLIPPEVEAKLLTVRTPEDLPAVQIFWMGNSHAKEIVVDRKIHMSGSHNWLSYRGDRLPRGETVHQVTNADLVQEAYEFLAGRFQSHAQKLWDEAARKRDSTLAVTPLCVWGALDMHEEALNQLRHNNWLQLLPLWLKVACQGLRSQKVPPNSASLKTAILLLSQISAADSNIELLREGWQKVVGAIASQERDAALRLLSDEAWLQFGRLGITQSPIDSPERFISKYNKAQNNPTKTPNKL